MFERKRLLRNCVLFDSNSVVFCFVFCLFVFFIVWLGEVLNLNIQVLGSQLILWKALIFIRFDS